LEYVAETDAVLEDMTSRYKLELAERRKYFNLVQELRGLRP